MPAKKKTPVKRSRTKNPDFLVNEDEPKKEKNSFVKKLVWPIVIILVVVCIGIAMFIFSIASVILSAGSGTTTTESSFSLGSSKVAVIPIEGVISTSTADSIFGAPQDTTSSNTVAILKDIAEDSSIEAVIFHINSPGGYVVPSHKITRAVQALDIPTVSVIEDVGASGAYMVASATDYIIADDFSMVGSIGVTASSLNFAEFIDEYNVTYQRLVAGKYKDLGTPFKEMTDEELSLFQNQLDSLHDSFIFIVAQGRDVPKESIEPLATGQVYLGVEAMQNGLVDALGDMDTANDYLERTLEVDDVYYIRYGQQPSLFDSLFLKTNNPLETLLLNRVTFSFI